MEGLCIARESRGQWGLREAGIDGLSGIHLDATLGLSASCCKQRRKLLRRLPGVQLRRSLSFCKTR